MRNPKIAQSVICLKLTKQTGLLRSFQISTILAAINPKKNANTILRWLLRRCSNNGAKVIIAKKIQVKSWIRNDACTYSQALRHCIPVTKPKNVLSTRDKLVMIFS